jgi:hypothetical protein
MAELLKDLLDREGFQVTRVDQHLAGQDFAAALQSAIRRCSTLVALVDQPTSNVMLELGYALGAAKQVVLVGGSGARVPFDVSSLPMVRLDPGDPGSMLKISKALRGVIEDKAPIAPSEGGRSNLERMLSDAEFLDSVTPGEFEEFVLEYLRELGLKADLSPPSADGGYDIVAELSDSSRVIVEVKKYSGSSRVGLSHVRQLVGAMMLSDASCGILVTSSQFSSSALGMAESSPRPVVLLTLGDLARSTKESITTACS